MATKLSLKLEDVRGVLLELASASEDANDPKQAREYSDLADTVESAQMLIKGLESAEPIIDDLLAWVR